MSKAKNNDPLNIYGESDFVQVKQGDSDEPLPDPVPKKWIGTDLLPDDVTLFEGGKSSAKSDAPVVIPEGDPTDKWTLKELDAYAEREKIDLSSAGAKKDERLAAIVAAKVQDTPPA